MTARAISRLLGLVSLASYVGAIVVGVAVLLGHGAFMGGSTTLLVLLVIAVLLLAVALRVRRRAPSDGP